MAYSSSSVSKPHLSRPSESRPSQQNTTSESRYSSHVGSVSSTQAVKFTSSHNRSPVLISPNGHAKFGHGSRGQLFTETYQGVDDQGEDSDYIHESTPGRAWNKREEALPRMRVVGFDPSTPCISRSGANDSSYLSQSRPNPMESALNPSGSSRQAGDALRRQTFQPSSDKSRVSRASISPITQHRTELSKPVPPLGSDVYQKRIAVTL